MRRKKLLLLLLGMVFLLASCSGGKEQGKTDQTSEMNERTDETVQTDCDAVFFGDSITCDGNFDELFPALRVVNLGVYGDTLEQMLYRVPEVRAEKPARIFLLGGINSLLPDNVEKCLEQYELLLDELRTACPEAQLVVESVLPVADYLDPEGAENEAVRRFNEGIAKLAEEKGCGFADLWAVYEKNGALDRAQTRDGLHLNFNAYGPWAEAVAPVFPAD